MFIFSCLRLNTQRFLLAALFVIGLAACSDNKRTTTTPETTRIITPVISTGACQVASDDETSADNICLNFDGFRTLSFSWKDQDGEPGTASDDEFVLSLDLMDGNGVVEVGRIANTTETSTEENTESISYTLPVSLFDFPLGDAIFSLKRVRQIDDVELLSYTDLDFSGTSGRQLFANSIGYLKAFAFDDMSAPIADVAALDEFGYAMALSADGSTLVVGARAEDSLDNSEPASSETINSGAVYIYTFDGAVWSIQQRLKSTPIDYDMDTVDDILTTGNLFGHAVAISQNGNTIAVGAHLRDVEPLMGETDLRVNAGAVYIYEKNLVSGEWELQQVIEAGTPAPAAADDNFGEEVALSNDGNILLVGTYAKDSEVASDPVDASLPLADVGGAYIFTRATDTWSDKAYIELSDPQTGDNFGNELSISGDGQRIAISAFGRTVVKDMTTYENVGAVYVYSTTDNWVTADLEQELSADFPTAGDAFGVSVALDEDGDTLAIGAHLESGSTPLSANDPDAQQSNLSFQSGAAYVFTRTGVNWDQEFYIKPSYLSGGDYFGFAVDLSADGASLAVSAIREDGNVVGVIQGDTPLFDPETIQVELFEDGSCAGDIENGQCRYPLPLNNSGAAYLFDLGAGWTQTAYIKSRNAGAEDLFGWGVTLAADASMLLVSSFVEAGGAPEDAEDSAPVELDNSAPSAGAVYFY